MKLFQALTNLLKKFGIKANKIELSANDILNLLAGNVINLGSKKITIKSDNFSVDANGKLIAQNGEFLGGKMLLKGGTKENPNFEVVDENNTNIYTMIYPTGITINRSGPASFSVGDVGENEMILSIQGNSSTVRIQTQSKKMTLIGMDLEVIQGTVTAQEYYYNSLESKKKNIEKYNKKALETVKNSTIYTYNFKNESNDYKKHLGFVIGNNGGKYETPEEVISNSKDGIDLYTMTSILWKATQEQQEQIEQLKSELKEIKEGN